MMNKGTWSSMEPQDGCSDLTGDQVELSSSTNRAFIPWVPFIGDGVCWPTIGTTEHARARFSQHRSGLAVA